MQEINPVAVDENPTPIHISASTFPMHQNACVESIQECDRYGTPVAAQFKKRFEEILCTIRVWGPKYPPSEEVRAKIINELYKLRTEYQRYKQTRER